MATRLTLYMKTGYLNELKLIRNSSLKQRRIMHKMLGDTRRKSKINIEEREKILIKK